MKAKEIKQIIEKDAPAAKGKKLVAGMTVCLVLLRLGLCLSTLLMAVVSHRYADLWLSLIGFIGLTVLCFFLAHNGIRAILYFLLGGGIYGTINTLRDISTFADIFNTIRDFSGQLPPPVAKVVSMFFYIYLGLCAFNQIVLIVCPIILLSARSSKRFFQICRGNKKMPDDAFCSE